MFFVSIKLFFLTFAVFCFMNQCLSKINNSTSNNFTPGFLEHLLNTNKFKEFIKIVQIPNTDLVNPAQRKTSFYELGFYNGLELGDILMRPGQILNPEQESDFNGHLKLSINKWKNGTVPYYISKTLSDNQTAFFKSSIQYNNQALSPNVNFRPYQNGDHDYVFIFAGGSGCYSNLGNVGGPQVMCVSQPCFAGGLVTHELQHVLGIAHENNRIDRENYIGIKTENIAQVLKSQYVKYTSENMVNTGPFDYYSIMFYPYKVPGFDISAFDLYQDDIDGNKLGAELTLSTNDIRRVKALYT